MQQAFIFTLLITFALSFVPAPLDQLAFNEKVNEIQLRRLSDSELEAYWKVVYYDLNVDSFTATEEIYGFPFSVKFVNLKSRNGPYDKIYTSVFLFSDEYMKKKIVLDCDVKLNGEQRPPIHEEFKMVEKNVKGFYIGNSERDQELEVTCKFKITH